jgi:hypothetical protein
MNSNNNAVFETRIKLAISKMFYQLRLFSRVYAFAGPLWNARENQLAIVAMGSVSQSVSSPFFYSFESHLQKSPNAVLIRCLRFRNVFSALLLLVPLTQPNTPMHFGEDQRSSAGSKSCCLLQRTVYSDFDARRFSARSVLVLAPCAHQLSASVRTTRAPPKHTSKRATARTHHQRSHGASSPHALFFVLCAQIMCRPCCWRRPLFFSTVFIVKLR